MDRKLLQEAANYFDRFRDIFNRMGQTSSSNACIYMRDKITAALAAPEPDAMDLAREICEMGDTEGAPIDDETIFEAAALISDYGKRVPRAMLDELFMAAYSFGLGNETRSKWTCIDQIAAKHGVKVEG